MKNNKFLVKIFIVLTLLLCNVDTAFSKTVGENAPSLKFVMVKFGIAMVGVVLFSIVLYVGLSIYNKFFVDAQIRDFNLRKDSLRTPRDRDEAIMNFITRCRLK